MKQASLQDVDGIQVLSLYGSWHEMGCQYGSLAKSHMADVLEYVEGCFLCSAMAAWGDYSDGRVIFGRNYDAVSYGEIDRDILVTVYHPDNALAVATIGYAGEIYCVNGINEKGIFIELNNGMPSAGWDIHWGMRPATTELFDLLFLAESLADVDSFFRSTRSFASFIIGAADRNEARSYEWCYDGVRSGDDSTPAGLMIRSNHYVNPNWGYRTPSDSESWDSITRLRNMTALAQSHKGHIDVPTMKALMSTPIEDGGPSHALTRYRIVAVPEDSALHIFIPYRREWVELHLF